MLAVVAAAGAWGSAVRAEGVTGYVEFSFAKTDVHVEDYATGLALDQTFQTFAQRYRLDFSRRFFPNLELSLGGAYDVDKTTTDLLAVSVESRRKRFTPYLRLTLRTFTFGAELAFERRQERFDAASATAELVQETWRANANWWPIDLPSLRVEASRRNTHDLYRATLDAVQDTFELSSRYTAVNRVELYYRGTIEENRDEIGGGELDTNFQNFRVSYADGWLDRRLSFSTDYTVNYAKAETTRSGTGELIIPVVPAGGLSSIDDTPTLDPLAPNAALVDGDLIAAAGVNLGLPGPGGDARPRNIGVDLGFATQINTLVVWIDRELTPQIASAFTWRVYTSDDNLDWTFRQTIPSVTFGPFENNFEVPITATIARYVKLVVSPLNASVPDATSWPDIQVTELAPELRQPSSDLSVSSSSTSQLFNADFRALLVPKANFYYDLGYFLSTRTNGPTTWTLSNGLSTSGAISPILTGAARLTREDRDELTGRQVAYLLSGSLTATPLPTVQVGAVGTFTQEDGEFGRDSASVGLTGTARLYRGIDATLSLGRTRSVSNAGGSADTTDATLGFSFVPHPKFTLNALVQNRSTYTEFDGSGGLSLRDTINAAEIGASYRPWRSLYLFGSHRWEQTESSGTRTFRNFTISWTPFPDGALHLNVFYDTTYRVEVREFTETLVPTIRWDITRTMFINLSYQYLRSTTLFGLNRTEVVSASFRAAF